MPKLRKPQVAPPPLALHAGQQAVVAALARYSVVVCGRRWGKTELGRYLVEQKLADGKPGVWWVAPTYQMAGQVWRDLKRTFRAREGVVITEAERRVDFAEGGLLAIRSAHHPDTLRGAGLDFVVLDEAAYMLPTVWPEVIRPMLLDRQGSALFTSTPHGRNWFWEVFQAAHEQPNWQAFQFPSHGNPHLSHADLAAIEASTTERVWRQEYLAEFLDNSGQVFRRVREAATASETTPEHGRPTVAGVDWGREGDYTVIVVLDAETQTMLAMDRFNQIGWEFQRGRLKALCEYWQVERLYAEANSIGSVNIEALIQAGLPVLPFMTTAASKPRLIEALALALETAALSLLPDETLLRELSAYTMRRSQNGQWQYSAPVGLHDDCVIALALAWHALAAPRLRLEMV